MFHHLWWWRQSQAGKETKGTKGTKGTIYSKKDVETRFPGQFCPIIFPALQCDGFALDTKNMSSRSLNMQPEDSKKLSWYSTHSANRFRIAQVESAPWLQSDQHRILSFLAVSDVSKP